VRISVDTLRNPPVTVFVNGRIADRCVEADTVEGWARVHMAHSFDQETLRGDVSIRWDRIAPGWMPRRR